MGCDIHMVVEERIAPGWWTPVRMMYCFNSIYKTEHGTRFASPIACSRNYERFAALAGVRGDGPEASGLPSDVNPATRHFLEHHGGDHSASWLPLAEALKRFVATEYYDDLADHEKKHPASFYFFLDDVNLEKYRLVFNFDS